jgi:hypothetical protein
MDMGYRTLLSVGLAALVASAPVSAQPASKDTRKLEAEIATLREQLSAIQAQLKKITAPESKDEGRFAKKDFKGEEKKDFKGEGKKDFKGEGKKDFKGEGKKDFFKEFAKKGFGPKEFPGQKGPQGEAKKGFGPPMGGFGRPGGPPGFGKGGFGGGFVPPGLARDRFSKDGDHKPGSAEWHEMMARQHMEAARELRKTALESRKRTGKGSAGMSPEGGGSGTGSKTSGASIEQRLERLQNAIEEIRRELRSGNPQPGLKKVGPRSE